MRPPENVRKTGGNMLSPVTRYLIWVAEQLYWLFRQLNLVQGSALAVDIDDAAVKVARENVQRNGLADSIRVMQGELKDIDKESYDLIFINIIADIILSVSTEIKKNYTKPGTKILLSGIIRSRPG